MKDLFNNSYRECINCAVMNCKAEEYGHFCINDVFKNLLENWHTCDTISIKYRCDMSHLWAGRKTRVHQPAGKTPAFF